MSQKIYSAAYGESQNSATQNSATRNSEAQNQMLASLPAEDYERLKPHFRRYTMPLGEVIYRSMEPITKLYFPVTALLSWIALLEDGSLTEIALVGNEGFGGLPAIWAGIVIVAQQI